MFWILLFIHALNPFLVSITIQDLNNKKSDDKAMKGEDVFTVFFTGSMFYAIWLGSHYFVFWIRDKSFNVDDFVGIGHGIHYFIPFIIGVVMLVLKFRLSRDNYSEKNKAIASVLYTFLAFIGVYWRLLAFILYW